MTPESKTTPMTDKELIFEITSAFTAALIDVLPPDSMKRMMNEINFAFGRYHHEREEAKKFAENKRYDI